MTVTDRRGSALMLVVIASVFLLILTAAAYRYLSTNAETQIWAQDRIQAKLSAEAGMNLATHMLVAGASLPTQGDPTVILGSETTPFDLPGGMGSVYVSADPSKYNDREILSNAFMLRCLAWVPGTSVETFGIQSTVMPENLARFSVFMDEPTLDGYYGDGYRFDGPFYANGPIRVYSESQTHENDVFFYSINLTSDYYIYGFGGTQVSTPVYGKLEMRPIERLSTGAPYFELGVEPIPFGPDELNWQGVQNAASSGGLVLNLPDLSRLALKGDTLFVKRTSVSSEEAYYLGDMTNPVIWIENSSTDAVYLRGSQLEGLDMALTIGCFGSFMMSGPLSYANPDPQDPDNGCLLGLMSVYGDMIIADDPGSAADSVWGTEHYHIKTDSTFVYSAVLVALGGDLLAENWNAPDPQQEFQIIGGYMIQEEGYTGTGGPQPKGFTIGVYFDPRLLFMHPPFFPTTSNWKTIMWLEVPDMVKNDVTNGDPEW